MLHGLAIALVESAIRDAAGEAHSAAQPAAIHAQRHNGQHAAGGTNAAGSSSHSRSHAVSTTDALTPAATSRESPIALLAQLHAAPHGPIEPQAGQEDGQGSQPAPSLGTLVWAAGAGIVHARCAIAIVAVQVIIPGTVVEQGLGAAQAGGIVDDRLGAAQARLVAHPRLGQRPGALALLAPAPAAPWTHNRILLAGIAGHHQGSAAAIATQATLLQQLLQRMHVLLLRPNSRLLGDDGLAQTQTQSSGGWWCWLLRGGWFVSGAVLQVRM